MPDLDETTRRWMRMKRYTADHIAQLHRVEREKGALEASEPLFARIEAHYGPCWHEKKTENEKVNEIRLFKQHIRKLWKPILGEDPFGQPNTTDLAKLHQADLAIYRDPYKVNWGPGAGSGESKLGKLYGKDAAGDQGGDE